MATTGLIYRKTLKRDFFISTVLIAILALSLIVIASSFILYQQQYQLFLTRMNNQAEDLAYNSAYSLFFEDKQTANNQLQPLAKYDDVTQVILFRLSEKQLHLFTSSNSNLIDITQFSPERLALLNKPQVTGQVVEVAKPTIVDGEVVGYLYLIGSSAPLESMVYRLVRYFAAISVLVLLLIYWLADKLGNRVLAPIERLQLLIAQIATEKNFNKRAPETDVEEIRFLSHHINTLLDTIVDFIDLQQQKEQQILQLNSNLEMNVAARTKELADTNDALNSSLHQLQLYQSELIEQQKMAALGQLVAGVAHEINTPIGIGVTAISMLMEQLKNLDKTYQQNNLTAKGMKNFLAESQDCSDMVFRNLCRAADLISTFKQVAVEQSNESQQQVCLSKILEDILFTLQPKFKHTPYSIKLNCSEQIIVQINVAALQQVIINMVMNSLIHGFDHREQGNILIEVALQAKDCVITITDDGNGIPPAIVKTIYDPFVTTKRGQGGSGLGMHLVYNLVSVALKGRIVLDEQHRPGARFVISFPQGVANDPV
ncbi:MAG: HAMP domain-containing protein [Gammaproteobacteria bacterium]|jgi:C4-dicarboxylate-specific signal transduction histidine kinase|nr:HAMP domain-containing protein [Gammaproteobacteria bacterium]